jgi:WXG100 family type VII secretion target
MPTPQQASAQTQSMLQAAQHVADAGNAIATIRNQVADAVGATTSGYQSPAADLFRSVMLQWHDDFRAIMTGLDNIGTALTGTAQNYQGAMNLDHESANQIAALLNGNDY